MIFLHSAVQAVIGYFRIVIGGNPIIVRLNIHAFAFSVSPFFACVALKCILIILYFFIADTARISESGRGI